LIPKDKKERGILVDAPLLPGESGLELDFQSKLDHASRFSGLHDCLR